jgi:hypothetical protein
MFRSGFSGSRTHVLASSSSSMSHRSWCRARAARNCARSPASDESRPHAGANGPGRAHCHVGAVAGWSAARWTVSVCRRCAASLSGIQ